MDQSVIYLAAVIFLIPLLLAIIHNAIFKKKNPNKISFRWGYYTIYQPLFLYLVIWIGDGAYTYPEWLILLLAIVVISIFALMRRKLGLVLATIMTANFLIMLINYIYLKNRWHEFNYESYNVRTVIFIALAWSVCVPVMIFLCVIFVFQILEGEFHNLMAVILVPVLAFFFLYFTYQKLIK